MIIATRTPHSSLVAAVGYTTRGDQSEHAGSVFVVLKSTGDCWAYPDAPARAALHIGQASSCGRAYRRFRTWYRSHINESGGARVGLPDGLSWEAAEAAWAALMATLASQRSQQAQSSP